MIHGIHHADDPITVDRALTATWSQGVGAEIMGRRKFGPQNGSWGDDDWRGWWGDEPPFRTPVFVMTRPASLTPRLPHGPVGEGQDTVDKARRTGYPRAYE